MSVTFQGMREQRIDILSMIRYRIRYPSVCVTVTKPLFGRGGIKRIRGQRPPAGLCVALFNPNLYFHVKPAWKIPDGRVAATFDAELRGQPVDYSTISAARYGT